MSRNYPKLQEEGGKINRGVIGMKVMLMQANPIVGDVQGNLQRIQDGLFQAEQGGVDLIVFPELFLTGYPPKDLLEQRWFLEAVDRAIEEITALSSDYPAIGILLGAPLRHAHPFGRGLFNAALLFHGGELKHCQAKSLLPTYDVFDEARYFDPAVQIGTVLFKGEILGISICEDAWNDPDFWGGRLRYHEKPIDVLAEKGATLMINISASPFEIDKESTRVEIMRSHARTHRVPFIYLNQVGGNDELLFDGASFFLDSQGSVVSLLPRFEECVAIIDTDAKGSSTNYSPMERVASVYAALVMGIRDYMRKTGFQKAVLGLSGGIDSAVTAVLACAALGPENVLGITMPSPYSSLGSVNDSRQLADNLGMEIRELSIESIFGTYLTSLEPHFLGIEPDVTEENIQARIRGTILMAFSNKLGYLLLSTGNKSEMAMGYCTLYGDMSGGLSVLSDIPKTLVYKLADCINGRSEIIPKAIIEKAPSAELRPDQKDMDSLPPYPILDRILAGYIEEGMDCEMLVAEGLERETVEWVIQTVNRNEYKRRQAAPGLKVTTKAFGGGRRMPIAAKYGFFGKR